MNQSLNQPKPGGESVTPTEPVTDPELNVTTPVEPVTPEGGEPTPPATPADDLTDFRQKLNEMSTQYLTDLATKHQPVAPAAPVTPTPEPATPVSDLEFQEFAEEVDLGRLNTTLKSIVSAVNKQQKTKIPAPVGDVSKEQFEAMNSTLANVQGEMQLMMFFIGNQDLLPYADYVRVKARQISAADQNMTWPKLFTELGKQARAELRLPEEGSITPKQPIRRGRVGSTDSEAETALQQELDELDY